MTYKEFWESDPTLVIDYRKAEELRNEKKNQELWLQGLYIYEALCDVSPIFHDFAKRGTKPHKYADKPYAISKKEVKNDNEIKVKNTFDKGMRFMEALRLSTNKKYEKGGVKNG